jgi:hypothetical protein
MAKAKKSRKRRFGRDALDWQERHSPTVEIAVDDPEAKRKTRRNLTRCRQSEAWRHNQLTGMQREAEKEMEFAWRARTAGLGASGSRYGRQGSGLVRIDIGASADATWREWVIEAPRRRIVVNAAIDCLAEPLTLGQVERRHGLGQGMAMANYMLALDLWCELRGWIGRPRLDDGPHLAPECATRA